MTLKKWGHPPNKVMTHVERVMETPGKTTTCVAPLSLP